MKLFSLSPYFLVMAVLSCAAGGCKSRHNNEARVELYSGKSILNDHTADPNWIYNGKLPKLVDPRLIVSLKSHTVRIKGWVPAGFDTSSLPDYAHVDDIGDKKRLMVVYPIATVDPTTSKNGNAPGSYYDVSIFPWNPDGVGDAPDKKGPPTPWGGFPYIQYNHNRSIAFHGPIDSDGGIWRLRRGPVSHACNRMQGEHITELAHLLGTDMTARRTKKDYSETKWVTAGSLEPLVLVTEEFDKIVGGTLDGKLVDVDYPVFNNPAVAANLQAKRPTGNVQMFKTWDARSHPTWVCAWRKARDGMGMKQCADLGPASGGSGSTGSGSTGGAGAPSGTTGNTNICAGVGEINVRNNALIKFASANAGEPVKRLGNVKKDATGMQFEEVFFINEPSGPGWIASKFLPPCS